MKTIIENGSELIMIDGYELNPEFSLENLSLCERKDLNEISEGIMCNFFGDDDSEFFSENPEDYAYVYEFIDYYYIVRKNNSIRFPKSSIKFYIQKL